MLTFAAFVPHPPIIIPEIGKDNLSECKKTVSAMEKLAKQISKHNPDTIIIISPHGNLSRYAMTLGYAKQMKGDFSNFDAQNLNYSYRGDPNLAKAIKNEAANNQISTDLVTHNNNVYQLDHGVLVPLYYLTNNLPSPVSILPIGYSADSRSKHFTFGQVIYKVIKNSSQKVAVIASGDLSHRLNNGNNSAGKEFDQFIVDNIRTYNPQKLLTVDEELQQEAGECGYRSLLILLGVLDGKKTDTNVLSYEAPFGVGYLVAQFVLP